MQQASPNSILFERWLWVCPVISFFFLLPKGVILLMEKLVHSSAGPHSAIFQEERVGQRSPAPVWIRRQPSLHPPCVLDPSLSFLHSKRVTPRGAMQTAVTRKKMGLSTGTLRWLERQQSHLDVLRPVALMGSCLFLQPTGLSLLLKPLPTWTREKVSNQDLARLKLRWNSPTTGERKAFPTWSLRKRPAETLWRTRLCWNQTRNGFSCHLKFCHQAAQPEVCRRRAKKRPKDSAKVTHASWTQAQIPPKGPAAEELETLLLGLLQADLMTL